MDIQIKSLKDALNFIPEKPTYAIRIHISDPQFRPGSLIQHPNYLYIAEYEFDDNDTHPIAYEKGPVWISSSTARDIITDFSQFRNRAECLLIHCFAGKSRSPSVALALNDIFNLGHRDELIRLYPGHNRHTYETILETAREMKLI